MRRSIAQAVGVAVGALILLLILGQTARASDAALVVRHGDGSITYALVNFEESEMSSFELLERSTLSLTTVAFGGLGEAVCTLDGEGCPVADCQQRVCQTGDPDSEFWQFFRPGSDGSWVSQPLGASTSRVRDGDVDVWSWTGADANVPPMTIATVAESLGVSLDRIEPGSVHVASFDASGNRIESAAGKGRDTAQLMLGGAMLAALAVAAVLLARRRRAAVTGRAQ